MLKEWDCGEVRGHFSELYDRVLDPAEEGQLDAHLASCGPCRADAAEYRSTLDDVSGMMRRAAADRRPSRPFPQLTAGERPRLRMVTHAALAMAAAAILALVGVRGLDGPPSRGGSEARLGRLAGATGGRGAETALVANLVNGAGHSCPWSVATREELARVVSYPVVADDCLEDGFELVEATVRTDSDCGEAVRLRYRAGARELTLDQTRPLEPPCTCAGDPVPVGDLLACLELTPDATSLSWSREEHTFRLSGELDLSEAVRVASDINTQFVNR